MTERKACPYCHKPDSIDQIARFELPGREVFSDRSAHLMQCKQCSQVFMSVYEESRAGALDSEAWDLYHYYLPQNIQQDMLINATLCPNPTQWDCNCPIHQMINQLNFAHLQKFSDDQAS